MNIQPWENQYIPWSEAELNLLREGYPKWEKERLQKSLSNRKWKTIEMKARRMGIPRTFAITLPNEHTGLTSEEASYIAGLIDGDGAIMLIVNDKIHYNPIVQINSVHPDFLRNIQGRINQNRRYCCMKSCPITGFQRRPMYKIQCNSRKAYPLLKEILPFLRLKKRQAELLIEWLESRYSRKEFRIPYTQREREIYKEIKLLNKRGV